MKNKELSPLEALEKIGNAKTKDTSFGTEIKTNLPNEYRVIESTLKQQEQQITDLQKLNCKLLELKENALNDNHFYKHIISRLCGFMGLDIKPFEDLIKTENEMINYICENECFRVDVATNKNKLKVLEIIKEKPIVALVDYKYTYEEWLELVDEREKDLFRNKKEYDLLKEVLL